MAMTMVMTRARARARARRREKGMGNFFFEVKAGGGKDDSPAKNLRKRNAQSPVVETRQRRK
jgi:hypothetical protein